MTQNFGGNSRSYHGAKYSPNGLPAWGEILSHLQLRSEFRPLTVSGVLLVRYHPFPPVFVPFNMFNVVLCGTLEIGGWEK